MLDTKHNSCLYFFPVPQSFAASVHTLFEEIGRFSGLETGGGIHTNYTYWSLYTILHVGKKF